MAFPGATAAAGVQDALNNPPSDGITGMRIIENKWLLVSSWDTVNNLLTKLCRIILLLLILF
jgi:hypothetical protein